MNTKVAYSIIERAISDQGYLRALSTDADALFKKEGLTDPIQIAELKTLTERLVQLGGARTPDPMEQEWQHYYKNQLVSTEKTMAGFKSSLLNVLDQISRGFRYTSIMYTVAFYLGVGLVVFSMIFAVYNNTSILAVALGGLGIADLIAFFITNPPRQLESSRADLAQLTLAYYNWFVNNHHWAWFISDLWSWEEGHTDRIREGLKEGSAALLKSTEETMRLIEGYCEFASEKMPDANTPATLGTPTT